MGRFTLALAASTALAAGAFAQTPPASVNPSREVRPMRERWRNMSPEDRQRFKSNMQRWLALPPEARQELRAQEIMRRQRMRDEADAVIRDSGLQLEGERRQQFQRQYLQERRRIDRALRQELQERRQKELAPVIERLKKEFGQPPPPAGASPSPTK